MLIAPIAGGCASESNQLSSAAQNLTALPESRGTAETPPGFISFCLRFPDQCSVQSGPLPTLDDKTWETLQHVNKSVNEAIWPEEDARHYGSAEYWTIPTDGYGDCDDYALTKRQALLKAGLPSSALRLAVVYSRRSGNHAVLTVATDKGALVLDNLNPDIASWNATRYTWIAVQDSANPWQWDSLPTGATVTASLQKNETGRPSATP